MKLTLDERIQEFTNKVTKIGHNLSKELLTEFIDYWTEHNEGGIKARWEMQKIFNISRRLGTWKRNSERFNSGKKTNEKPTSRIYKEFNLDDFGEVKYKKADPLKIVQTDNSIGALLKKRLGI